LGRSFEAALFTRTFEPDSPNFTPRIAGIVDLTDELHAYKLAIIKTVSNDSAYCLRHLFNYAAAIPGIGHCVTTYKCDGDPLPPFEGEPYVVELRNSMDEVTDLFWDTLDEPNKVAMLVKFIDTKSGESRIRIVNKHEQMVPPGPNDEEPAGQE
jgi:hypothetical protein